MNPPKFIRPDEVAANASVSSHVFRAGRLCGTAPPWSPPNVSGLLNPGETVPVVTLASVPVLPW